VILPTATSIKARFSEFSAETDPAVEFAIEEAARRVDSTWVEKDQTLAVAYLAGHFLMCDIARRESASGQRVASETIGGLTQRFENTRPTADDFGSTLYGMRFKELAKLNFSGGLVV
jgi:hypothetical protein